MPIFWLLPKNTAWLPGKLRLPTLRNASLHYNNTKQNIMMAGANFPEFCLINSLQVRGKVVSVLN
jgi:hypothetical protein